MSSKEQTDNARAKLRNLKTKIKATGKNLTCDVFLFAPIGSADSPENQWRRMKFSAPLAKAFGAGVLEQLMPRVEDPEDLERYTFAEMASGNIGYLNVDDDAEVTDWFGRVPAAAWQHVFDGDQQFLSKVKFHVTSLPLGDTGERLLVFRHRGEASLIYKGGIMAIFDPGEHLFKPISKDVFHFDHGADSILWKKRVFIFNFKRFESLTNIRTVTIKKAKRALRAIEGKANILVPKIEQIVEAVESKPLFARKIAAADWMKVSEKLTGEAMKERIQDLSLPIQVKNVGKKYEFNFDVNNPHELREFINLITDYYLRSPVTKQEYRAPVKYPR